MKNRLDEINRVIASYGMNPFTEEKIREYETEWLAEANLPENRAADEESFRCLWQRITEMEGQVKRPASRRGMSDNRQSHG
jgi:hypothetical protein